MTPEEINVAMAELCGWEYNDGSEVNPEMPEFWIDPSGRHRYRKLCGSPPTPDYYHDLNAMNEAEKTLKGPQECDSYIRYLCVITDMCAPFESGPLYSWGPVVCATATQRAEAFLRTIGKWKE